MDVKIENNDLYLSGTGELCAVRGIDEAAQRVWIACTVKKGSFLYDRDFGADFSSLRKNDPALKRKLEMVFREAAFGVPDTKITVKAVRQTQGIPVAVVMVIRKGESKEIEVALDGKL